LPVRRYREWPVDASEKTQERRLPRAVGSYEADAFAVVESSTKTREYFARPIVTFEIGKPQQFHAEPYICARPARRPSRLKLNLMDGQARSYAREKCLERLATTARQAIKDVTPYALAKG
jgi:hypothetical protein